MSFFVVFEFPKQVRNIWKEVFNYKYPEYFVSLILTLPTVTIFTGKIQSMNLLIYSLMINRGEKLLVNISNKRFIAEILKELECLACRKKTVKAK